MVLEFGFRMVLESGFGLLSNLKEGKRRRKSKTTSWVRHNSPSESGSGTVEHDVQWPSGCGHQISICLWYRIDFEDQGIKPDVERGSVCSKGLFDKHKRLPCTYLCRCMPHCFLARPHVRGGAKRARGDSVPSAGLRMMMLTYKHAHGSTIIMLGA